MRNIIILFGFFPLFFYGQLTFSSIPLDKQLVGRDLNSNLGDINISGFIDKSDPTFDFDNVQVKIFRGATLFESDSVNHTMVQSLITPLSYTGSIANFEFQTKIPAELFNYSFKIYGLKNNVETYLKTIKDVVAGDVFIIQGQSNAVASLRSGSSNGNQSNFIRVFASGYTDWRILLANKKWYIGQGDGDSDSNGNTGQWALKLARMFIDNENIPIAIFNGARGGSDIYSHRKLSNIPTTALYALYQQMLYRLTETGLKNNVRGLFWSQGEADGYRETEKDIYKERFKQLKTDWLSDFPNIEKIYIFQTKNSIGCSVETEYLMSIKEAQRQLAFEDPVIHIMQTASMLSHTDNCHFQYSGGYEEFANRLYKLVDRDMYGGQNYTADIETPMILDAYLTDDTTLKVETDAISLSIASFMDISEFKLGNAATSTITDIAVSGRDIIFTLSEYPGPAATISYYGQETGAGSFITNTKNLELVCFNKYPIEDKTTGSGKILITQYYEGGGNNQWIEVKNISGTNIPENRYFLALYDETDDLNGPPTFSQAIPSMEVDEVLLFKNNSIPTAPIASNIDNADQIGTNVCTFNGNDIVLISGSNDEYCYKYRQDIIGVFPPILWGQNKSFIRGSEYESPEKDFNIDHWIELSNTLEVDVANITTNIALGTQDIGNCNWNGGWNNTTIPDRTRNVEISSGIYSGISGDLEVLNLVVNSELNFDNNEEYSVVVYGDLTINGSFIIGDKESMVMINDNATITGVITKLESSTQRTNQHDITYWSSPVSNETIGSVFAGVTPSRIFYYDQNNSTGTDPAIDPTYWNTWVIASGSMRPGFGYAAEGPTGTTGIHNISFTGRPNNGLIAFEIYENSDGELDNDWNLVGNPYPSAIDIRDFFTLNSEVIWSEIWLWTHTTAISGGNSGDFVSSDYAVYNSTGGVGVRSGEDPTYNIGSGQGFFVRGEEGSGGLLRFNNSLRIANLNNQFFKSVNTKSKPSAGQNDETDRIWLNLTSDENGFNQILIGFSELATSGIDKGYDALKKRSDNPLSFYSNIEGKKYVIQGLGQFSERESNVTLGFDTKVAPRVLTISIDKTEGKLTDADVYLIDNLLNRTHDLQKGSYTFEQKTTGENPNRFTLKFTKSNTGGNSYNSKKDFFIVSGQGNELKIRSDKAIKNIKVYDMFGRLLIEQEPKMNSFYLKTNQIKTGTVIILESIFENGTVVKRKTIKY